MTYDSKPHISQRADHPRKTVREAIGAGTGDTVVYEIEGSAVRLRRVDPFDVEFHEALVRTLDKWTSAEDEGGFP